MNQKTTKSLRRVAYALTKGGMTKSGFRQLKKRWNRMPWHNRRQELEMFKRRAGMPYTLSQAMEQRLIKQEKRS